MLPFATLMSNYFKFFINTTRYVVIFFTEKSCMVTVPIKRGDHPKYFDPTTGGHHRDEDTIHGHMIKLHQHMKDLFMKFLRCKGDSKKLLLKWIGQLMNEHACLFMFLLPFLIVFNKLFI